MILMYCYGSSFHESRLRLVIATPSAMMQQTRAIVAAQTATVTRPITVTGSTILPSPNEKVSTTKHKAMCETNDEQSYCVCRRQTVDNNNTPTNKLLLRTE